MGPKSLLENVVNISVFWVFTYNYAPDYGEPVRKLDQALRGFFINVKYLGTYFYYAVKIWIL